MLQQNRVSGMPFSSHAVAWSYDLLDDAEQTLLGRCSVFARQTPTRCRVARLVSFTGMDSATAASEDLAASSPRCQCRVLNGLQPSHPADVQCLSFLAGISFCRVQVQNIRAGAVASGHHCSKPGRALPASTAGAAT